ncbi:hypothetical protein T12_1834 [Trichinella patagoniensis]|uniref:Secreted protein n=1 Tax=Trichinella patagoniensis TaxID=990121 RepID=A0A0V0ZS46_9BILA|nr:hypothetical protein T12_1834 [Trichinella patagoniensis]
MKSFWLPSCVLSLAFCAFSDFAPCLVVKVGWRSRILPLAIISFENATRLNSIHLQLRIVLTAYHD